MGFKRTQQSYITENEGTCPFYLVDLLSEASPEPQENQVRHQNIITMEAILFPL